MLVFMQDDFLDAENCDALIADYKKSNTHEGSQALTNKDKRGEGFSRFAQFYNVHYKNTEFEKNNILSSPIVEKLQTYASYLRNGELDWCHVVKWDKGAHMNPHLDTAKEDTVLTSLVYLNDDYRGGETYFMDGTVFEPKKGRALFFDGKYFVHGVNKTKGIRYVLSSWYREKKNVQSS